MKRRAGLTVLLYALALLVLTVPAILIAFGGWGDKDYDRADFRLFFHPFRLTLRCVSENVLEIVQHVVALRPGIRAVPQRRDRHVLLRADGL
jgi:hypothetical protein